MAAPDTRRKTCVLSDICVKCGFSFIKYEKKENGELVAHKHFDRKLRFNNKGKKTYIKLQGSTFRITVLYV